MKSRRPFSIKKLYLACCLLCAIFLPMLLAFKFLIRTLIICTLIFDPKFSQALLIRSQAVPETKFHSYIKAHQVSPFSKGSRRFFEDPRLSEQLQGLILRAQDAWLRSSMQAASLLFLQMTDLAFDNDWREAEREAVFLAFLRLAQIHYEDEEKWLRKAFAFAPDIAPPPEIFPPPLIRSFHRIKSSQMSQGIVIRPAWIFPKAQWIRHNGRLIEVLSQTTMTLPVGRHRLSVFSNDSLPWTETRTAQEWETRAHTPRTPLAQGVCEHPGLQNIANSKRIHELLSEARILFPENCVLNWIEARKLTPSQPKASPFEIWTSLPEKPDQSPLVLSAPPTKKPNTWIKNPWLWVSLGTVVTTSVLLHQRSQDKSDTVYKPVHR